MCKYIKLHLIKTFQVNQIIFSLCNTLNYNCSVIRHMSLQLDAISSLIFHFISNINKNTGRQIIFIFKGQSNLCCSSNTPCCESFFFLGNCYNSPKLPLNNASASLGLFCLSKDNWSGFAKNIFLIRSGSSPCVRGVPLLLEAPGTWIELKSNGGKPKTYKLLTYNKNLPLTNHYMKQFSFP